MDPGWGHPYILPPQFDLSTIPSYDFPYPNGTQIPAEPSLLPIELVLPTGPVANFLPKDPKEMSLSERGQYHTYIYKLITQACYLKDKNSYEHNVLRLRYIHGSVCPWAENDPLQGGTQPNDKGLLLVMNTLTSAVQANAMQLSYVQARGLGEWSQNESLGMTVDLLKMITDLMNGRHLRQIQLEVSIPSVSDSSQSSSNEIAMPEPEEDYHYNKKTQFNRSRDAKSPFCEYHQDAQLTDWDDLPLSEEKIAAAEPIESPHNNQALPPGVKRQYFYGPWQSGGQRKPWMLDAKNLTLPMGAKKAEHIPAGGYDLKNVWYNHKDQYYVDTTYWRLDVGVITQDSMAYVKEMCRYFGELQMNGRLSKQFLFYKTNHPMIFVFIFILEYGTIHKGFIIFQGRNVNDVPLIVFKTPNGLFRQNVVTKMMELEKWDIKRPFYDHMKWLYRMAEEHMEDPTHMQPQQSVITKDFIRRNISHTVITMKRAFEEFKKREALLGSQEEESEPYPKRICQDISSGVNNGAKHSPDQRPDQQGPSLVTWIYQALLRESNMSMPVASQSGKLIVKPNFANGYGFAPQNREPPPRKNAVYRPAPITAPVTVPYRQSGPDSQPASGPSPIEQPGDYCPGSVMVVHHGPPSPITVKGNSPPPPRIQQPALDGPEIIELASSPEEFDPPQLSPRQSNSQSLPSSSPPMTSSDMRQRSSSVNPTRINANASAQKFPPIKSWF